MTRKEYERVADILAWRYSNAINAMQVQGDTHSEVARVVHGIATDMAAMFAEDNPRFDRERFYRAVAG